MWKYWVVYCVDSCQIWVTFSPTWRMTMLSDFNWNRPLLFSSCNCMLPVFTSCASCHVTTLASYATRLVWFRVWSLQKLWTTLVNKRSIERCCQSVFQQSESSLGACSIQGSHPKFLLKDIQAPILRYYITLTVLCKWLTLWVMSEYFFELIYSLTSYLHQW